MDTIQNQGELLEREKIMRSILENASDLIIIVNKNGKVLFVNRTLPGFKMEEVIGKSVYDYVMPEYRKENKEALAEVFHTGERRHIISKAFGPYKSILWYESIFTPIKEDDRVVDAIITVRDITERKKAEEALKESEEKYRLLIEKSLDGINLTNEQGNIIEWNQGMEEITGYKKNEVVGRPVWDVQFECAIDKDRNMELKEEIRNTILQVLNDKNPRLPTQIREQEIRCQDGTYKTIQSSSYVIKKGRGAMIGSIFRDISKLKETEHELKEHLTKMEILNRVIMASNRAENTSILLEEILNSILEVMNLDGGGIYLINESTKSAELIHIKGLNPEFIKQINNIPIKDEKYREVLIEGNQILAENLPIKNKIMAKISGFKSVISIPLFSKERIIGAMNIGSKRRYTISEIEKEIFKSLSREVGTAISKMQSEEALRKSEALYREAFNRAEFYKDILAHDISNILQSILTTTDLSNLILKRGENIDDLINLFNDLKIQVERGAKLVLNVRTLSKIENVPLSLNQLEVNQVLNDVIKKLSQGYQKNVKIQLDSQNSRFLVYANELLVEVFENILINAIRHNNNPQVEITVRISKFQENKRDYTKIEFIDNGMGIEDSQKDIIFQRGYEEGKSTSGMGLGLSLVKKILQIYDGKIWVEDRVKGNPSGGSNFIVLIPEDE